MEDNSEKEFDKKPTQSSNENDESININNRFSEMVRPIIDSVVRVIHATDFSGMRETLNLFARKIGELCTFDYSAITESMRVFSERLSEVVKGIQFPEISDEQKQELLKSYQKWGEYGWTINPCADYETLFDTVPETKKDADAVAMRYCNKKYMVSIFDEIRKSNRMKKSDFEEAVFAFDSSKYKSCSLILFALIDAKLIRLQKRSDFTENQKRRKVGIKAVEKAMKMSNRDLSGDMLFTALFYKNLFSCLLKVFEDGNDFRTQPKIINRNFLDHGMLTRRVTRKDCIQLFLLYYNILTLLDMQPK